MAYSEITLAKLQSPYQKIELTQIHPYGNVALYLDDAVQFVSGFDDVMYHWSLATCPAMMLGGRPAKALILGGGDGLAARNLLAFPNIEKVHMVELDPVMVDFCAKNPIMRQLNKNSFHDPRLTVTVGDAKKWVERTPSELYDLALLDFPDPLAPELQDLFAPEMYNAVKRHMAPMGEVIAVQSSSAFSDTEEQVTRNLFWATGVVPCCLRFRGRWMEDGCIVIAGKGLKREAVKLPKAYEAKDEKVEKSVTEMSSVF